MIFTSFTEYSGSKMVDCTGRLNIESSDKKGNMNPT